MEENRLVGAFDTHTHLDDEKFDADRQLVIDGLADAGIKLCMCVGADMQTSKNAVELSRQYPFFYAVVGVHPHSADEFKERDLDTLRAWLMEPKVKAVGEIGLDYHYDFSPREVQRKVFARQLAFASEMKVPAVFHVREAHGDMMDILCAHKNALPGGVLHCYTGSWESAVAYMDMGFYISFSGSVTFKNAPKLVEVARKMPLDRLLIETDCPYMAPVPMRGHRNEPAFVLHTAQRIAEIRSMPMEELLNFTMENGKKLFGID